MRTFKLFGVLPLWTYGSLPDDGKTPPPPDYKGDIPANQTKFLSPRYEPSNITQNATVAEVQAAIRLAENGDVSQLARFYRDVLLSDDHIQSCFNTRKLALLAQPLNIMPEDKNNPDDVSLAAALTQAKTDCENWNYGMLALLDGCLWWNSIVERLYKPAGKYSNPKVPKLQYTLRKFVHVNPQLHCYQWAYLMGGVGLGTASAIQLAGMAGQPGAGGTGMAGDKPGTLADQYVIDLEKWEPYLKLWPIDKAGRIIYDTTHAEYLDPTRHIVHRGHLLQSFRDNWGGPMRAILMWWLFRGLGREWFARGMERYGSPWPVGYTDATDPQAVNLLTQAFDLSKKIGGLVVDESSRVELKEAIVQGMAQGYETFYNLCNEAIAYHITGLRKTEMPTGMNAGQSDFQAGVRQDVRAFDQMMLGETCVRGIAIPFRDLNGLAGNVKFVWGGLSKDDAKKVADLVNTMKQGGLTLDESSLPTVNEQTGLVWKISAPIFTPPTPGVNPFEKKDAPEPPKKEPDADEPPDDKSLKPNTSRHAPDLKWLSVAMKPTPVDDVVAKHSAALATAFRGNLAPVRQIILNSTSRADAEQKLKLFFADWKPDRIAEIVEQAMQVCAAQGAVKATEAK